MKTVYFYTLKCPITNDVKYVGRSVNPDGRYRQHIHSGKCEGHKDKKGAWIKSLLDKDLKPIMEIIDKLENYKDIEEVKRKEEFLILEFRKTCDLKNDRDIVENGYNFSKESRQKMSDAQKGKKKINKDGIETSVDPFELKDFLENGWQLGRIYKPSKETLEKLSLSRKGKKHPASFFEKKNKPILQYDKEFNFIKEWESCTAASIELKINQRNISSSTDINSNRKSAGGFIWRYKSNN